MSSYRIRLRSGEYVTSPTSLAQKVGNPSTMNKAQLITFFNLWSVAASGWLGNATVEVLEVVSEMPISEARADVDNFEKPLLNPNVSAPSTPIDNLSIG